MEKTNLEIAEAKRLALRNLLLTLTTAEQVAQAADIVDKFPDLDLTEEFVEITLRLSSGPAGTQSEEVNKRQANDYSKITTYVLSRDAFRSVARLISLLHERWQIAAAERVWAAFREPGLLRPIQDAIRTLKDADVTNVITPVASGYTVTVTLGTNPSESTGQFGVRKI